MKKHWPEAIASIFFVGLGQIIKGHSDKGLKLILIFYFVLPTIAYLALTFSTYLFILLITFILLVAVGLWSYNVWDAFTA